MWEPKRAKKKERMTDLGGGHGEKIGRRDWPLATPKMRDAAKVAAKRKNREGESPKGQRKETMAARGCHGEKRKGSSSGRKSEKRERKP